MATSELKEWAKVQELEALVDRWVREARRVYKNRTLTVPEKRQQFADLHQRYQPKIRRLNLGSRTTPMSDDVLVEAFKKIITHRVPLMDDLILELDGTKVRVSSILQEIEDATEIMPVALAELLGLPAGVSFAIGVQVYRANAPRAILKRQAAVINPPAPTAPNGTKKPLSGRRFDPDTIRLIRQQAAEGTTNRELGERHGVDPSFISEIVRRVAYADVV